MAEIVMVSNEKRAEYISKFKEFLNEKYLTEITNAALEGEAFAVDYALLEVVVPEFAEFLLNSPAEAFEIAEEATNQMNLPDIVKTRFYNLPEGEHSPTIRDIRTRHIGKFISTEGVVRRASEIRPEIVKKIWQCIACGEKTDVESIGNFAGKPFECSNPVCGKRFFKEVDKVMVDARWLTIDEPFELAEGERPSQINVVLKEDLVTPEGRRITEPGNRLKITGILKEFPKDKAFSVKLDFFLEANHVEPTEIGWERVDISPQEEAEIREMASDPRIYDKLVASLAPSLYGMEDVKESIIMQLFGGVHRKLKDKTGFRGDIHVLLIGDPAAGKCVTGDTLVTMANGNLLPIKNLVESKKLENNVSDGFYGKGPEAIISLDSTAKSTGRMCDIFWKRKSPEFLYDLETESGRKITVTPTHPFFVLGENGKIVSKKAENLRGKDFLAVPRKLPIEGSCQKIKVGPGKFRARNLKKMKVPETASKEFCKFIAYLLAEGYVQKTSSGYCIWFCNNDKKILEDYKNCASIFGLRISSRKKGNSEDVYISSAELGSFLKSLGQGILKKSREKEIPDVVMCSGMDEIKAFLSAFFESEGHVSKSNIEIASASRKLLEQIRTLLLRFGICSSIHSCMKGATNVPHPKRREYHRLNVSGAHANRFREKVGFLSERKIAPLDKKRGRSIRDVVPNLSSALKDLRKSMRMKQDDFGIRTTYQHFERGDRNPTRKSLKNIVTSLEKRWMEASVLKEIMEFIEWEDVRVIRESLCLPQSAFPKSQGLISQYELGKIGTSQTKPRKVNVSQSLEVVRETLRTACSSISSQENLDKINILKALSQSDIYWDRISLIKRIKSREKWVYDLQVPGVHNFVANNFFVHNSQLLKLAPQIMPRGKYVSGKGTTTAGLTATVTKDELMGGWVLEAGAMVLANKGLLAVDEFEKMSVEDQVAMHEGLEQGSVSVAKASIVATLPAKTSVLAGGNPKFSRFDPYLPISKQITIPDTLLSRFDLKFALRDIPNAAQDKRVVEHVLKAREEESVIAVPVISPEMIRKYIAFAKNNCAPQMTKEAGTILKNFYIRTRKRAEGGQAPVPITLRQFEALMRISEASAKIQLSDIVRKQDAERAIRLMTASLKQLGYDPETGVIDIDRSEGSTTSKERSEIRVVLDLINELSKKKKEIPIGEVESEAKKQGIDDIDEVISKLKREGMIYEPSPGRIQKV